MKRTPLIGRTGRARPRPDDDRAQHALGPAEEAARRAVQEESRARTGGSRAGHGLCVAVSAVLALPEDPDSPVYRESLLGLHGVRSSAATVITAGATPFGVLSAHSTRESAFGLLDDGALPMPNR